LRAAVNTYVDSNEIAPAVVERLSTYRQRLGLSERGLAKRLGVSNTQLSYLKHGQRKVTPSFLAKVAHTFPDLYSDLIQTLNISGYFSSLDIKGHMRRQRKHEIGCSVSDFLLANSHHCTNIGMFVKYCLHQS